MPHIEAEIVSDNMETIESFTDLRVLRDEMNFIQNVSQFFNEEALSDIILKVNQETYFAHKFVLAKSSDVFRTMLYEKSWSQGSKAEVELNETPECQGVFSQFLKYLYTAEVSISTTSAVGILCLADKYNVDSLKQLCVCYMIEHSKSPKVKNALNWYPWAKALHFIELIRQCTKTIAWNYLEIITSAEWTNMDLEFLYDMLLSSELVVPNEFAIWEALKKWLLSEAHEEKLKENAEKLLPLVRFPQMVVSQLYGIEEGELASNTHTKDLLHELLNQAYRFRALCPSQAEINVNFTDPFYIPRDYTDLTVDNVRMQNTLRFGIQVDVKMYKGPVPSENRDADWKITYRKQGEIWTLLLYCHETGLVHNEARIQPSIIIFNDMDKVMQVFREPACVITRGNTYTIQLSVDQPSVSRHMSVLLKPMPQWALYTLQSEPI